MSGSRLFSHSVFHVHRFFHIRLKLNKDHSIIYEETVPVEKTRPMWHMRKGKVSLTIPLSCPLPGDQFKDATLEVNDCGMSGNKRWKLQLKENVLEAVVFEQSLEWSNQSKL